MKIIYKYKLRNSENISEIGLSKAQYYDPVSKEENYEDDAIPSQNDRRNYCPGISKTDFEWDEILISESIKSDTSIRTEYYGTGNSWMTYRRDKNGFELIIQSMMIKQELIYISRMERRNTDSSWENIIFTAGVYPEGGPEEEWYNLKKGELLK
jgi:hypothetical protein